MKFYEEEKVYIRGVGGAGCNCVGIKVYPVLGVSDIDLNISITDLKYMSGSDTTISLSSEDARKIAMLLLEAAILNDMSLEQEKAGPPEELEEYDECEEEAE